MRNTFNLNAEDATAKVTDRTKAILPVHLFDQAADMTAIGQLAQTHSPNAPASCAPTAQSPNIITKPSAAISDSMNSKPRCCV